MHFFVVNNFFFYFECSYKSVFNQPLRRKYIYILYIENYRETFWRIDSGVVKLYTLCGYYACMINGSLFKFNSLHSAQTYFFMKPLAI